MKLKTMMVCLLALMVPLAYAHEPAGTPKIYCEPAAEWNTHDYGPPATGRLLWGFIDGNLDDCDGDFDPTNPICWAEELTREDLDGDGLVCEAFDYDGHAEWSRGGAWILSCNELCGDDAYPLAPTDLGTDGHPGSGSLICFGEVAHHASFPTVRVVDNSGLGGIGFRVAADYGTPDAEHALEHDPVTGEVCGDFRSDVSALCFDVCTVTFPPGLDGSYQVYVEGTAGHVCTPTCGGPTTPLSAIGSIELRSDGSWSSTYLATGWGCSRSGNTVTCTPPGGSTWTCNGFAVKATGLSDDAQVQGEGRCNAGTAVTTNVVNGIGTHATPGFSLGTVTQIVCSAPVAAGTWLVKCTEP